MQGRPCISCYQSTHTDPYRQPGPVLRCLSEFLHDYQPAEKTLFDVSFPLKQAKMDVRRILCVVVFLVVLNTCEVKSGKGYSFFLYRLLFFIFFYGLISTFNFRLSSIIVQGPKAILGVNSAFASI